MEPLFNIFTILKQFFINIIVRIAQNIENYNLQNYYVNYKFKTMDNIYSFEIPIILEIRNEIELNILHARIGKEILNSFILTAFEEPQLINESRRITLLNQNALLDNSEIKADVEFILSNDDINKDKNLMPIRLNIKLISTKTPKEVYGKKIYAISDISYLFKFQIPTQELS